MLFADDESDQWRVQRLQGTRPPLSLFFSFLCSFRQKLCQIIGYRPLLPTELVPPDGDHLHSFQFRLLTVNCVLSVCNAGFYTNGTSCLMCTGLTIKKTRGNAVHCDEDAACDGWTTGPNENHTICGESSIFLLHLLSFEYVGKFAKHRW